jgi:hypothetical protein
MPQFKAKNRTSPITRKWMAGAAILFSLLLAAPVVHGEQQDAGEAPQTSERSEVDARALFIADVCRRIETAAQMWKLPPDFFARLIWKESRFDPKAVSPKGASGIAQFTPGTAQLRNLDDPFDPRSAIPASAHYLSDLRNKFGNLGLAAAAYNAGPNRVRRWRSGRTSLPGETRDFVISITGFSSHEWNGAQPPKADYTLDKNLSFLEACRRLPVRRFKRQRFKRQRFNPHLKYASASWEPWGVQLTADWSPTRALSRYADIQRKFPGVLAGRDPMVLRVFNYSLGKAPRFRIQIGQPDRSNADSFCKRLRHAGGSCLVYKTQQR